MESEFITISQEKLILLRDRKIIDHRALAFFFLTFQAESRPEIPSTCANLEPMAQEWGLSKIQLRDAIASLKSKGIIERNKQGLPPRQSQLEFKQQRYQSIDPRVVLWEKLGGM
jgi:hypothetical protein